LTLLALVLVLAAACSHATWNLLVKRVGGGPEVVWLFSMLAALLYLPVAIWVIVVQQPVMGPKELMFCTISSLLHLGYFLLLQQGYRRGDLSLVYPTARATGPLLSGLAAVIIFAERPTLLGAAGGLAIIAGVFFLTGGLRRDAKQFHASLLFGLGAGALIGAYTVWDAHTLRALLVPPILLDYASSLGRVIFLSPYAVTRRAEIVRHWREHKAAILEIAVFNPLAYILVLTALVFTPVVYVAPARESSVLITVLLGTLLLKEGEGRGETGRRLGWAALILAGMVMLALG